MSIIKTSSLILSAAALILATGAANAMVAKKKSHTVTQHRTTHAVRSTVQDFSAPKGPLPAKEYFERQRHDGY